MSSSELNVSKNNDVVTLKGALNSDSLGLGGKMFQRKFSLSQITDIDVTADLKSKLIQLRKLSAAFRANGQDAFAINTNGNLMPDQKVFKMKIDSMTVSPGARSFVPAELLKQFKLANLNLNVVGLDLDANKDVFILKGKLNTDKIGLGGTMFSNEVNLSQNMDFDITFNNANKGLDLRALDVLVKTDDEVAIKVKASGNLKPEAKSYLLTVDNLDILQGTRKLIPAELIEKYSFNNVNLIAENISVNYVEGKAGHIKAKLKTDKLGLNGTAIKPVTVSQSFEVNAAIDAKQNLDLKKLNLMVQPSGIQPFEVMAKGKVDLSFKSNDSEIFIDIPQTVDINAMLDLLKKQQQASTVQPSQPDKKIAENKSEPVKQPDSGKTKPTVASKPSTPIKLTVNTSLKELKFKDESIKNVKALAYINGKQYTLRNAALQIGQSIIQANGYFHDEAERKLMATVKSNGLFDLAPFNRLVNTGKPTQFGGKVEIQQLDVKANGKTNNEFSKNLVAAGKILMQDLKAIGYGGHKPTLYAAMKTILGPDPNNIQFDSAKIDFGYEKKVLTLNQSEFTSNSIMTNVKGTLTETEDSFETDFEISAGFAGGDLLQIGVKNPQAMNMLTQKSDKFREFQKEFPYSSKYRMFTLASPIVLKNSLKKDVGDADTITGLNGTVSQLVEKFSIEVAKRANFKEIEPVLSLLKGDLKSLLNPSLLEGLLQEGLNRHINKDDDKKEDKKKDPLGGLLEGILGGGSKKTDKDKEAEAKRIAEEKKRQEQKKKEEEKKKKINKEDDLIKKLDDLFK